MSSSAEAASAASSIAATAATPTDSVASSSSMLASLESLPPRAQKRRRGERFKTDEPMSCGGGAEAEGPDAARAKAAPPALEQRPMRERKFEYLDHTADIQLHSWGATLTEALEQNVLAMFSYITDLTRVDVDPTRTDSFEVQGHDLDSLLFNLLDEFLYRFATNEWIVRDISIEALDLTSFTLRATGYGEHFTLAKHTQGTEIKAITYSNMQILVNGRRVRSDNDERHDNDDDAEGDARNETDGTEMKAADEQAVTSEADRASSARSVHGADIYVIVDI